MLAASVSDRLRNTMTQGVSAVPWYRMGFSPLWMGRVTVRPKAKGGRYIKSGPFQLGKAEDA